MEAERAIAVAAPERQTFADFVEELAARTGLSYRRARQVARAVPELVRETLLRYEGLRWPGLGTFYLRRYVPRRGARRVGEKAALRLPAQENLCLRASKVRRKVLR